MMTSSGPWCDVGDHYILLEDLEIFSMPGILGPDGGHAKMFTCEAHKAVLIEMTQKKDWTILPNGVLRRFLEAHQDDINTEAAR